MIYIIDDDKYVRNGFNYLLKSADLESIDFGSIEEFLEAWTPDNDDLIILDIQMIGMNGCDLMKHLVEHNLHVRIVVITAYDEKESRECAKKYGVLAYMRKPVDGQALIDIIRHAFIVL